MRRSNWFEPSLFWRYWKRIRRLLSWIFGAVELLCRSRRLTSPLKLWQNICIIQKAENIQMQNWKEKALGLWSMCRQCRSDGQNMRVLNPHSHVLVYLAWSAVESFDDTNVRMRRDIVIYAVILLYTHYLYENINTNCPRFNQLPLFVDLCLNSSSLSVRLLYAADALAQKNR